MGQSSTGKGELEDPQ